MFFSKTACSSQIDTRNIVDWSVRYVLSFPRCTDRGICMVEVRDTYKILIWKRKGRDCCGRHSQSYICRPYVPLPYGLYNYTSARYRYVCMLPSQMKHWTVLRSTVGIKRFHIFMSAVICIALCRTTIIPNMSKQRLIIYIFINHSQNQTGVIFFSDRPFIFNDALQNSVTFLMWRLFTFFIGILMR